MQKPTCIIFDKSRCLNLRSDNIDGTQSEDSIFMTHICRNSKIIKNILAFSNLSNTQALEFLVIENRWGSLKMLPVDTEIKANITLFLQQTNTLESRNQDCMDFLKHCIGEGSEKGKIKLDNYIPCNPNQVKPGGIIFMDGGDSHHGAIYLGAGIYISRFGPGGPIGGTSLEQLISMYKPNNIIAWNTKTPSR